MSDEITTVNGNGLWNSWTRNFKTPLLALLDLFDNAIDAPLHGWKEKADVFEGKIHVKKDTYRQYSEESGTTFPVTSGIYMINNSSEPIKDISKILEVYASSKGKASESIGENGVGLKQGCATLSDMSFVLTRNQNEFSLGIIASMLQRDDGITLPSFKFAARPSQSKSVAEILRPEMMETFESAHANVGECVKIYGKGDLECGIDRLIAHFENIYYSSEWDDENYVFCVILHELRHGSRNVREDDDQNSSMQTRNSSPDTIYKERALGLLDDLYEELPRHYIHIPTYFDVRIDSKKVLFYYWQQRLVELNVFHCFINPVKLFTDDPNWKDFSEDRYPIRILCGFNPLRRSENESSSCCLYIYSRYSGRLIKTDSDARNLLGLTNSGTHYCQGLTVIVDDSDGRLPLNPTKQDIAFGEEASGGDHQKNLYAWTGAITYVYYNYYVDKCGGLMNKSLLTEKVKEQAKIIDASKLKGFDDCDLSSLQDIKWCLTRYNTIRPSSRQYVKHKGQDTLKEILCSPEEIEKLTPTKRKRRRMVDVDEEHQTKITEMETKIQSLETQLDNSRAKQCKLNEKLQKKRLQIENLKYSLQVLQENANMKVGDSEDQGEEIKNLKDLVAKYEENERKKIEKIKKQEKTISELSQICKESMAHSSEGRYQSRFNGASKDMSAELKMKDEVIQNLQFAIKTEKMTKKWTEKLQKELEAKISQMENQIKERDEHIQDVTALLQRSIEPTIQKQNGDVEL